MSSDAWKRDNTMQFAIRIGKNSDIAIALRKMQEETGVAPSVFVREAMREKLIRNGYLTENSMPEK